MNMQKLNVNEFQDLLDTRGCCSSLLKHSGHYIMFAIMFALLV